MCVWMQLEKIVGIRPWPKEIKRPSDGESEWKVYYYMGLKKKTFPILNSARPPPNHVDLNFPVREFRSHVRSFELILQNPLSNPCYFTVVLQTMYVSLVIQADSCILDPSNGPNLHAHLSLHLLLYICTLQLQMFDIVYGPKKACDELTSSPQCEAVDCQYDLLEWLVKSCSSELGFQVIVS